MIMSKPNVSQMCVFVPNQPGALAKVTQFLSKEGVNIGLPPDGELGMTSPAFQVRAREAERPSQEA